MTWIWNNSPALPVVLLLPTAIAIPLFALIERRLARWLALAVSLTTVGLSILNLVKALSLGPIHYHMGGWPPPIGIEYVLDPLSAFVLLVINTIGFLVLVHAKKVVDREIPESGKHVPYYAVAVLMLCGFNGIVVTGDFFNLYVWLEIASLSLYGLIAVGSRKAPVAAIRYLILGTIGACFYLLGLGFLFTMTGTLNMADLKAILPAVGHEPAVVIGLGLIVAGMGLKMALFPLHGWLPDSYTYAPSSSSALIAPIGTKVGAYVLIRVLFFIFGTAYVSRTIPVTTVIGWLAAAGILYGSIMAMAQTELKRMLAYSSIAQVGYIGLGIGLANPLGLIGAVLHLMNHAAMKALLFLVAGNFRTILGHSDIARLDGSTRRRMPWTTAAFAVGALSMIGIPPLAGFFSKWYLALGAVAKKQWIFLAVILLSSLLNAVYFFRVIERIYFARAESTPQLPGMTAGACSGLTLSPLSPIPSKGAEYKSVASRPRLERRGLALANGSSAAEPRTEASASMLVPVLVLAAALIGLGVLNAFIVKGVIGKIVTSAMF